ncbi:Cyclic pyranopterin monophosphate synthase accessory protein [Botrimarina colliarenosi]|uniref:Molybdopterin adenylyltransferase n=1 Tax=Botrimarina colliarenosi TaxID=2528001 RepID=A0A5C6AHM9_9BACT|nr:bifunctional molybdenum cofactor biosynthesis protein MoaC/MoaB [Botrimarina colliarenosi]TWT99504.1 Cyclic pyranopterin monophosphate synthase accessory protein [Botrimarina colliarenosi]
MTRSNEPPLSHLDTAGRARMVDVGGKPVTDRRAVAEGRVDVGPEVAAAIRENSLKKGDLLQVARLGGVQAAKRTADLVLLCHPLPLAHIDVEATLEEDCVVLTATVRTAGQTGVEMEALAAVAGAALNVVDMGKSLNPAIEIRSLRVVEKTGGKSGPTRHHAAGPRVAILTVSDSRSAGAAEDLATPLLADAVQRFLGGDVVASKLVPDDRVAIATQLRDWASEPAAPSLVLTTGGTGVGPRDVTPEATIEVAERLHPGLLDLARARCLPGKPHAYLSRGVAGVVGRTLIVNLPGSPRGAVETLRLIADVLPHTLETLRGEEASHP